MDRHPTPNTVSFQQFSRNLKVWNCLSTIAIAKAEKAGKSELTDALLRAKTFVNKALHRWEESL